MADLTSGTKITPETVFDIGSTSKQFTATALLLLVGSGKINLNDRLSQHLTGFPAWADDVTLAQLMHHTSGIPDYERLWLAQGHSYTERTTQRQAMHAIAQIRRLQSPPGSTWDYSNSNYLLLGEVVREVAGSPLPHFLAMNIFDPLDLKMIVKPVGQVPGKARAYRRAMSGFEVAESVWEQIGDGGVQTTPSELVRWADNYRTGTVGGASWLKAVLADTVPTQRGGDIRYGAGIEQLSDGSLVHSGRRLGFETVFWISKDRRTSIAFCCNRDGLDMLSIGESLVDIWTSR